MRGTPILAALGLRTGTLDVHVVCYLSYSFFFFFFLKGCLTLNCMTDIPAHTYQATFEPNKEWSEFYASAPEIHRYWKRVADKFGCGKYIKLKQQVVRAAWSDDDSQWKLQVSIPSRKKKTKEAKIEIKDQRPRQWLGIFRPSQCIDLRNRWTEQLEMA